MQPSIVLGVNAFVAARRAVHCREKVCKGSEMLWYGYKFGVLGVKVELV